MKRKITLTIIIVLLAICMIISLSYAWYFLSPNVSGTGISTNVDIPDCASVSLTNGMSLNLTGDTAAPISDNRALSSTDYRYGFTVTNNCNKASNLKIAIAPSSDSTMPVRAIKYALLEKSAPVPSKGEYLVTDSGKQLTDQIIKEVYAQTSKTVDVGYELINVELPASGTKDYYLYLWIDYYEGDTTQTGQYNNSTMNTSFDGQLIVSDFEE